MLKHYLYLFFISMLPLVELRLAVPVSQALGLPVAPSFIVCMLGNMIPVPLIYFFARKVLTWGSSRKYIGSVCRGLLNKGEKTGRKLTKRAGRFGTFFAIILFVGIPLPGTGAWTGTLAASILDIGFKTTVVAVTIGVIIAAVIMMTGSLLGVSILS
jgi:uncharacterized membrane protein